MKNIQTDKGITPVVHLCLHIVNGLTDHNLLRVTVEGEEMDRWLCSACWKSHEFDFNAGFWTQLGMDQARSILRRYLAEEVIQEPL